MLGVVMISIACEAGHVFTFDETRFDDALVGAIVPCPSRNVGGNKCGARLVWQRSRVDRRHALELPKLRGYNSGEMHSADPDGIPSESPFGSA